MMRLLLVALLTGVTLGAQSPDTLVVGTYTYSTNDRVAAVTPLAQHLGAGLHRPVRVVSYPDPTALADAVRGGRVDVVVTNTFGYLLLAQPGRPAAMPIATYRIKAGERSNYGAVVVTRAAAVESIDALRRQAHGLSVALVAAGSTTGNLVPRLWLASQGLGDLEKQFARVSYAGTHAGAYVALRGGGADVAALASEEYDKQVAADSTTPKGAWRELWRSPDITLGPIAVRASLPARTRRRVAALIVGLERTAPEAFAAVRGGWVEARNADAMVAADDHTYDSVRRMMGDPVVAAALIARFAR